MASHRDSRGCTVRSGRTGYSTPRGGGATELNPSALPCNFGLGMITDPALEMPSTFLLSRNDAVICSGLLAKLILEGHKPTAMDTSCFLYRPRAQSNRCCKCEALLALMSRRRRSTGWRVSRRATTGGKFWLRKMGRQQWRTGATTSAS